MAVGDVISDNIAANTAFQPAAGVEVCITFLNNLSGDWDTFDGTNATIIGGTIASTDDIRLIKLFIDNGDYIRSDTAGRGLYSGVQVG